MTRVALGAIAAASFDFGGVRAQVGLFFTIMQAGGALRPVDRLVGMAGQ